MNAALVDHGHRSKEYIAGARPLSANELNEHRFTARIMRNCATACAGWWTRCAAHEREIMNCA